MTLRLPAATTLPVALLPVAMVYLLSCGTIEWRSAAIRNQGKVIALLTHAQLEGDKGDSIRRIALGKQVVLTPEREQIAVGYVLVAHVHSSRFTIEARPAEPGKTGLFSYFLDEGGIVRFEMGRAQASATSRPLGPAHVERSP
jgi:hypothetical protein